MNNKVNGLFFIFSDLYNDDIVYIFWFLYVLNLWLKLDEY